MSKVYPGKKDLHSFCDCPVNRAPIQVVEVLRKVVCGVARDESIGYIAGVLNLLTYVEEAGPWPASFFMPPLGEGGATWLP